MAWDVDNLFFEKKIVFSGIFFHICYSIDIASNDFFHGNMSKYNAFRR